MSIPELKDSSKNADPKFEKFDSTLQDLKEMKTLLQTLGKNLTKAQQLEEQLAEIGDQNATIIKTIATHHHGDLGRSIANFGEEYRQCELKRKLWISSLQDDVIAPILADSENHLREVLNLEKMAKKQRSDGLKNIDKLQRVCFKAQKKNPQGFHDAIDKLSCAIKDHNTYLSENLRKALLLERKHYCNFMRNYCRALGHQSEFLSFSSKSVQSYLGEMSELAASEHSIPEEDVVLINDDEGTTIMIRKLSSCAETGVFKTVFYPNSTTTGNSSSTSTPSAGAGLIKNEADKLSNPTPSPISKSAGAYGANATKKYTPATWSARSQQHPPRPPRRQGNGTDKGALAGAMSQAIQDQQQNIPIIKSLSSELPHKVNTAPRVSYTPKIVSPIPSPSNSNPPPAAEPVASNDSEEELEGQEAVALFDFSGNDSAQVCLVKGEKLLLLEDKGNGWSFGEKENGDCGWFPTSYVSVL